MRNRTVTPALLILAMLAAGAPAQTRRIECTDANSPPECAGAKLKLLELAKIKAKISEHLGLVGRVVRGAPYSAEAVTETTQILGDGNRITRHSSASIHRDAQGRVRREERISAVGPWPVAGEPTATILISDPVANVNYVLDPKRQEARRTPLRPAGKLSSIREEDDQVRADMKRSLHKVEQARVEARAGAHPERTLRAGAPSRSVTESLGKKTLEGVEAEGRRTITTIPAGEIGNLLPIEIVSEQWYSPDLQAQILTRRSDPRSGETIYRLINIRREDPPHHLFEVPSEYRLRGDSAGYKMLMPERARTR